MINVLAPDDKIEEGTTAVAVEAKRARDFGFSTSELERAKKNLAAAYDQAYRERDKSESGGFARVVRGEGRFTIIDGEV